MSLFSCSRVDSWKENSVRPGPLWISIPAKVMKSRMSYSPQCVESLHSPPCGQGLFRKALPLAIAPFYQLEADGEFQVGSDHLNNKYLL